jgi:hypothetical protein
MQPPQPSEVNMIVTNYTPEDLKKLPLRAIVALSARCARRVEHLALLPDDHPENERCRAAVGAALRVAEDFARGLPCSSLESVVREIEACRAIGEGAFVHDWAMAAVIRAAHAAATALHALALRGEPEEAHLFGAAEPNPLPHLAAITADLAARDAFTAAVEAVGADGHTDQFLKGAIEDYEKLLQLELGSYPQAGKPIDPSSSGPLGPLEPEASLR